MSNWLPVKLQYPVDEVI